MIGCTVVLILTLVLVVFIYGPNIIAFAYSLGGEIQDFFEECIDDWRDVFKAMKERIKEKHRGK